MIDNKKFRITNTRQFEQLADKFAKQIEWDNLSETDLKSLVEIIEMERDRQGVSYKEILDKWSEEGCSWLDSCYPKFFIVNHRCV